jgi:hypothetical protein
MYGLSRWVWLVCTYSRAFLGVFHRQRFLQLPVEDDFVKAEILADTVVDCTTSSPGHKSVQSVKAFARGVAGRRSACRLAARPGSARAAALP